LKVSIVILTWNRCDCLIETLDSLSKLDAEFIVVNNGSTDNTATAIEKYFPHCKLVSLPENIGTVARNNGITEATGDIIITLDDDVRSLTQSGIQEISNSFENSKLGALTFQVLCPKTGKSRDWVHRQPIAAANKTFPTYEITEGAVAFRASALKDSGLYLDDYFISHEGLDLAYRLLNSGWEIYHNGLVTVEHFHDPGGRTDWRRYYYDTRNLFWISARFHPLSYALPYIFRGVLAMKFYAMRDLHFLAWMRGVTDGIKGMKKASEKRTVWTDFTTAWCKNVDSYSPGLLYLVKRRIFSKNFNLD
jgi:GT2 family glycosyltransferase